MNTRQKLLTLLNRTEVYEYPDYSFRKPIHPIICADGFIVSMQASQHHYCTPRDDLGPWTTVELGFPSDVPTPAVMQYAEDEDIPTETVYAYVPITDVADMVDQHGGLAGQIKYFRGKE